LTGQTGAFVGVWLQTHVVADRRVTMMNFHLFAMEVIRTLPIRKKTRVNYESNYRCHIEAALGHKELEHVRRSDIQQMILGLQPQVAALSLAITKSIFREAIAREIIDYSPATRVKGPTKIVKSRKFLTWEQLSTEDFGKYTTQIRFLALHGLRWGEAMALTDEDFHDGRIFITKSIHGATKSQSSIRSVPHVSEFKKLPSTPKALRRVLAPYGVHIHSLRHTYAYMLKAQGVHVTTAQRLLGHSDPRVTMDVYTRVLDNEIDDVGDLLGKMITAGI
jgi:integrase